MKTYHQKIPMNERNDILQNFVVDQNRKKQQSSNNKKNNLSSNQKEKEEIQEDQENHHHQILVCSDLGSRGLDFSSDIQV